MQALRFRGLMTFLLPGISLTLVAAASAGPPRAPQTWPAGLARPKTLPVQDRMRGTRPGILMQSRRIGLAPAQSMYVIHDVGTPNGSKDNFPTAFNNSGQITGYMYPDAAGAQRCVVWNGTGFFKSPIGKGVTYCLPMTINALSSNAFEIGGYVGLQYDPNSVAFTASTLGKASLRLSFLSTDSQSIIDGLNSSGVGIGESYDQPATGTNNPFPPFVLQGRTNLKDFSLLQPSCEPDFGALCMLYNIEEANQSGCPFGGCSINDSNVVLGEDASTTNPMIVTVGQPASAQDLPVLNGAFEVTGINNANQITYDQFNASGPTYYQPWQYTVGASVATALGQIPGYTCSYYYPLSENNLGEVFGRADQCTQGSTSVTLYWTWNSLNGMQNLSAEIPPSAGYRAVYPIGVNDKGQILAALETSTAYDWGTLDPPPSMRKLLRDLRRHVLTRGRQR